jgi:Tfp pilus assembly protein PilX
MKSLTTQRGTALLVSLIMLVVLTLFAISAISTSIVNLKIVGNVQVEKTMSESVQQAIEQFLSNPANFSTPPTTATTVNINSGTMNDATVTVSPPTCLGSTPAAGYSLTFPLAPQDTVWEVQANVTNAATGATEEARQGVKVRLPAASCI